MLDFYLKNKSVDLNRMEMNQTYQLFHGCWPLKF